MGIEKKSIFTWQDYLIIAITMLISAGIGVYYRFTGGKQKTIEEYFSANREMSVVTVGIAMMVSLVSAVTIMGICAEIYTFGFMFVCFYAGSIIGIITVSFIYLPVFFQHKTMSVYEYLEKRFGATIRLIISIANFLQLTFFTGVVLYAPSLAIEASTGLSSKTSITIIAIICIFYSTIGGIKAVLITDVLQAALMFASLICILVVAAEYVEGGISNVWNLASQANRTEIFDFRLDPTIRHTSICLFVGGFFIYSSVYGVNQVEVQRLLTVKTLKQARIALFINLPLLLCMGLLTSFSGLVLYAVYKDCDPRKNGDILSNDRIMPYFAATKMTRYPGLVGVFISGIFSATLSTISALLNSLAAVFLEDYLKRIYTKLGRSFPKNKEVFFGKLLALLIGCVCVVIAFLSEKLGSLTTLVISIAGSFASPLFGIFTLGMLFEGANEIGAIIGMTTSLLICLWASFGQPRPRHTIPPVSVAGCNSTDQSINITLPIAPPVDETQYFYLYRISYMWYSVMGTMTSIAVGLVASYIVRKFSRRLERELDPTLFTPIVARRILKRRADIARTTSSQVFTLEEPRNRREQ